MASVALLILVSQSLLLAPQVSGLSAYTDDAYRLRQHQRREVKVGAKATMDAGGQMKVKGKQDPWDEYTVSPKGLQSQYPFYHTTDELRSEALRLSEACGGKLNFTTVKDSDVEIDVITVRKKTSSPVNRVFILFGEHSRELISPESGLYLLRALCGDVNLMVPALPGMPKETNAEDALEDSEFQMVINGNPRSRRKVEAGDFCLRTDPNGVDLNRNWDEQWEHESATFGSSSNPGPKPFSEPETRIFLRLVTDYAPTTFLTVHSGTRGMYMPYAYDMEHTAKHNSKMMMEILKTLDKDHCQCPFGAAGKEVGYPCPGTCLDYAYAKLSTPFAFAFEIYVKPDFDDDLKQRWKDKMNGGGASLLEKGHNLGHPHFTDIFGEYGSDFVGTVPVASARRGGGAPHGSLVRRVEDELDDADRARFQRRADSCFQMFNPEDQDEYDEVVKNWVTVYLQMSALVVQQVKDGKVVRAPVEPVQ